MNHTLLIPTVIAAVLAGQVAGHAEGDAWSRLGEVRDDTLYVELDRLTATALERNEMLAVSNALTAAASAEAAGAWAGFLPHVSVGEYYLRSDDPLNAFGYKLTNRSAQPADFAPDVLNHPGEVDSWITQLKLLQPVFNGGMNLYGKQAAEAGRRAAQFRHRRAEETVRLQAAQVYESLTLTRAMTRVVEAAVRTAEGHVQQATAMVNAEMATEADLMQARVFLATLRQQYIAVRNQAETAADAVRLLTAIEVPLPIAAAARVMPEGQLTAAPDSTAVAGRADLLAAQQQARAAGKTVGVATGALLPHLDLSLERNLMSQDRAFGDDARSWSLGVYATWNIFDGLQSYSALRKAKADKRAAEHSWQFASRQAWHEARQAWRDARAAQEQLAVAGEAIVAAREGLRILSDQYAEGLASMTDLLDVQAAEIAAEGGLVQAQHDYNLSLARLAYAAEGGLK